MQKAIDGGLRSWRSPPARTQRLVSRSRPLAARLQRRQVLMNKLYRHRAFAHGGGHALDGAVAHVAGHEDAGDAAFEPVGGALEAPAGRVLAVLDQIGTGQDEAALVALQRARYPFGARLGADEDQQGG